jgi:hypothetical protein
MYGIVDKGSKAPTRRPRGTTKDINIDIPFEWNPEDVTAGWSRRDWLRELFSKIYLVQLSKLGRLVFRL